MEQFTPKAGSNSKTLDTVLELVESMTKFSDKADEADRTLRLVQSFWRYLFMLFETPRPSTNFILPAKDNRLDPVRNRIKEVVEKLKAAQPSAKYDATIDQGGNLIIRKNGVGAGANDASICLQGHLDIVCSKNEESKHDFEKDGLLLEIVDEKGKVFSLDEVKKLSKDQANNIPKIYIRSALQSTLGADNGVSIAAGLAAMEVLDSHPPIELLCTANEETDFFGAENIDKKSIKSKKLLNLDTEEADGICIGCAGGFEHCYYAKSKDYVQVSEFFKTDARTKQSTSSARVVTLKLKGFHGGHSGVDIHKSFENSNIVLLRLMFKVMREYEQKTGEELFLLHLKGGTGCSAISREATCTFVLARLQDGKKHPATPTCKEVLASEIEDIKEECKYVEDVGKLEFIIAERGLAEFVKQQEKNSPQVCLAASTTKRMLNFLSNLPHGVLAYVSGGESDGDKSSGHPPLVESSINFGVMEWPHFKPEMGSSEADASTTASAEIQKDPDPITNTLFSNYEVDEFGIPYCKPVEEVKNEISNACAMKPFNLRCWRCQDAQLKAEREAEDKERLKRGSSKMTEEDIANLTKNLEFANPNQTSSLFVHMFFRSSCNTVFDFYQQKLTSLGELVPGDGLKITQKENIAAFPAWQPIWDAPLLKKVCEAFYRRTTSKKSSSEKKDGGKSAAPRIYAIHAGLECGVLKETFPALDCCSIGPNIEFAHSPDERLEIDSCTHYLSWLEEVLYGS